MKGWPTDAEIAVMKILQDHPQGLYGLQIVEASNGQVKVGSIYVLLGKLTLKGFLKATKPKQPLEHSGPPRPIYRLSAEGSKVLIAADGVRHLLGKAFT